jgi:hypothetical protein
LKKYDRACLKLDEKEINSRLNNNEPFNLRIRVPEYSRGFKGIKHTDKFRESIFFNSMEMEDFVIDLY